MTDFGVAGTQEMAAVANVIATRPGTAPTGTVILTGHYDTVLGAPGAADDGIAIGVLLETARALGTAGPNRNTVMILLTDAEEVGLHGAEAFVRERAQELGTAVVLNHEASGAGGAPMTFRMSSPNGELLDVLAGAPGVSADSGSEATFASSVARHRLHPVRAGRSVRLRHRHHGGRRLLPQPARRPSPPQCRLPATDG